MSKLEEKIAQYTAEAEKIGIAIDAELLKSVAKGLGPSLYKEDAELVASSNKSELETIKKNFLIKKLGQEDSENLDAVIQKVIDTLGSGNRRKYRTLFYYLLVKELGMESFYQEEDSKEEEKSEKVEAAPVAAEAEKEDKFLRDNRQKRLPE